MADELLGEYQHMIEELALLTSSGGAFEVRVDDKLLFSKKSVQKRHAEPGEILGLFRDLIGPDALSYPS